MSHWVRTPDELHALVDALRGEHLIALDSESDSLHHHFEKVCLVQIAGETGTGHLIDPLQLRDLTPLKPLLADPKVVKVLHGADYDVVTLKRDFDIHFAGLFDTMIAARFLGAPAVGLQAVAQAELGVVLSKESQKDDWSRRPLTPRQEDYALSDVRHLGALYAKLKAALEEKDRLAWVIEESAAVAELEPARRRQGEDGWRSMKGVGKLAPRALAILREVWAWREKLAEKTDVPAFKIIGQDQLVNLSLHPPKTMAELGGHHHKGVLPRLQGHATAILEAVARGVAVPDAELPRIERPPRPIIPDATRRRIEALRAWRTLEAPKLGVDVSVVLPQRLLEKVAEAGPKSLQELAAIEGIRQWRVFTFGSAILEAAKA